ncbi:hypothetical protein ACIQVC_15240 [Streptomyces sp. NPDC101112]|uniref:hypothetical protein n=1 Tax=Streptomyces sp. NPDC101112 TaxID=3366105 RepID=UPI00382C7B3F
MSDVNDLRVRFPSLQFRRDRGEWIVGRRGNEQVIAVPEAGLAAMRLLAEGRTVEETRSRLRRDTGRDIDVRSFVEALAAAGFVASVGDRTFPTEPAPVSFPWLQPRHVRWALHPALHAIVLCVPVVGLIAMTARPRAMPTWSDLLWTPSGTFTLLVQCLVAWALIALHELAHLVTARAAGVSGRIRLGTRLQFLVAQTEVSGIWLKGRRERLTVYLAGLALDGVIWGGCLLALAFGVHHVLLPVVAMTLFASFGNQCLVFMRTDLYFVIQDLTGCRDLYGDGGRYLRHAVARCLGRAGADPLRSLLPAERRALRCYALGVTVGTFVCVVIGLHVLVDVTWPLFQRAAVRLLDATDPLSRLDALATVLVVGGLQALWARLWWRRHGHRVRRGWPAIRRRLRRSGSALG